MKFALSFSDPMTEPKSQLLPNPPVVTVSTNIYSVPEDTICGIEKNKLDQIVHTPPVLPAKFKSDDQPNWLNKFLNADMAQRIRYLSALKFIPCSHQTSRDFIPAQANCFGTLLWVIGADTSHEPRMYGATADWSWDACDNDFDGAHENYARILNMKGYFFTKTLPLIQGEPSPATVCHDLTPAEKKKRPDVLSICQFEHPQKLGKIHSEYMNELKSGDVLLFGTVNNPPNSGLGHAALYVGKTPDGRHMIFEKPSLECGFESPFQLTTLEEKLEMYRRIASDNEDGFHQVHVYRNGKESVQN